MQLNTFFGQVTNYCNQANYSGKVTTHHYISEQIYDNGDDDDDDDDVDNDDDVRRYYTRTFSTTLVSFAFAANLTPDLNFTRALLSCEHKVGYTFKQQMKG